jgi:hypothetical protein
VSKQIFKDCIRIKLKEEHCAHIWSEGKKNYTCVGYINVEQFFNPDAPSGEPVLQQIEDPTTGDVYAPGLKVTQDGRIERLD